MITLLVSLVRSGNPWEDADWRYLAHTDTHYAYGMTPEAALAGLAEVLSEAVA